MLPGTWRSPSTSSFSLATSRDHVASDDVGVVPFRVGERAGDDVLGHAVVLVGQGALVPGPGAGEALVGPAADQQRRGAERLVELVLLAILAAVELEGPVAVLEVLAAGGLHHAVERDELGHDDPSHLTPPQRSAQHRNHGFGGERVVGGGDLP